MEELQEFRVTSEQKHVLREVLLWLASGQAQSLTVGGYAGTGKTTLLAILRILLFKKKPKWRVAFASFTGKASQVLAARLKEHGAIFPKDSVSTLHSLLYSPIEDASGNIRGWLRKNELPYSVIIVDEASMVTPEIWQDVKAFGVPVLAVGDHGQLPPVGEAFPLMEDPNLVLKSIHRQAAESPIIQVAHLARTTGFVPVQRYGEGVEKFAAQTNEAQVLLDEFAQTYTPDTLFLTGFNASRVRLNHLIRGTQWRDPEHPESGDIVICLKNNWRKGLYNGLIGRVRSVGPLMGGQEPLPFYEAEVESLEGKLVYSGKILASPFAPSREMAEIPWKFPADMAIFDYGYALTVHKAQGSQAKKVVILEERSQHMSDTDWRRWLYTAVTRAERELYLFGAGESAVSEH